MLVDVSSTAARGVLFPLRYTIIPTIANSFSSSSKVVNSNSMASSLYAVISLISEVIVVRTITSRDMNPSNVKLALSVMI